MSSVEEHYERLLAAHYTWMSGGHEQQVARNLERLAGLGVAASPGARVLDLGCGSGFQALALAGMGFDVTGVDTSRQLLDELDEHAAGMPVTTIHGDMLDTTVYRGRAPFDVAVCMGDTLAHIQSFDAVRRFFDDLRDVLAPGAMLVLSFRDLSVELRGADRAIPVRFDDDRLMATFLEYEPEHVNVHDMIFSRDGSGWRMDRSAYRKLRLSGAAVVGLLREAGYTDIAETADGLTFVTTRNKSAP